MEHEPTRRADPPPDLDVIASDLAAAETALSRLDDGTFWTNPFPGDAVPEQ